MLSMSSGPAGAAETLLVGSLSGITSHPRLEEKQPGNKILWQTILAESSEPKQNFRADTVITVIDSRQSRLQKIIDADASHFANL